LNDLLKNKTIIITGGGTGLGKSMATRFGELGANLVLTSRRQEVLDEAARDINDKTVAEILTVSTDIRHLDQVTEMVKKAVDKFGKIDCLLNNAAGNFISPTENLSENAFRTIIDIVLVGTFNCTQAAGKAMRDSGGGVILNIVTTYAFTGSGYVVPSACAKSGVLAMTRSLAVEWAKYGIRTNAIAPGPFPTKGAWKRLVPPGLNIEKKMMERVPLKRFGEHDELANRFKGTLSIIFFSIFSPGGTNLFQAPFVGNGPGAIALVRIPYFAHSTARDRVIAKTPLFAQADGTTYPEPVKA
jgi:NAD(P)-dependent dehydrogenase (short-subunit alcohol dehydrogenase family)